MKQTLMINFLVIVETVDNGGPIEERFEERLLTAPYEEGQDLLDRILKSEYEIIRAYLSLPA